MVVKELHDLESGTLYAIQWEGDDDHCLNVMLENYTNPTWLRTYFKANEEFIKSGPSASKYLEKLVVDTVIGVAEMVDYLMDQGLDKLDTIFEDLGNDEEGIGRAQYIFDPKKYKGSSYFRLLRLYAIKDDQGSYFLTGFACKFSHYMSEHNDTALELEKLKIADKYIEDNKLDI